MTLIPWEKTPSLTEFKLASFPIRERYMGVSIEKIAKSLMHDVDVISFEHAGELTVYVRSIGVSISESDCIEFYGLYVGGQGPDKFVIRKCSWDRKRGPMSISEIVERLDCRTLLMDDDAGARLSLDIERIFLDNIPSFGQNKEAVSYSAKEKKNIKIEFDMSTAKFAIEYSSEAGQIVSVEEAFLRLKGCFSELLSTEQQHNIENPRISYVHDLLCSLFKR